MKLTVQNDFKWELEPSHLIFHLICHRVSHLIFHRISHFSVILSVILSFIASVTLSISLSLSISQSLCGRCAVCERCICGVVLVVVVVVCVWFVEEGWVRCAVSDVVRKKSVYFGSALSVYIQNVSVCTGNTSTCFYTCGRVAGTHGDVFECHGWGVSNLHTGAEVQQNNHVWTYQLAICRVYTSGSPLKIVKLFLHFPPDTYTSTNTNQSQDHVRLQEHITQHYGRKQIPLKFQKKKT